MPKPKVRGKVKKLPSDTDVIMPGWTYPKSLLNQVKKQRKTTKKK
jgi:hypothetical protein